ncbi:MAG: hypothetical protein V4850_28575 [Myxococcota bacterium]
MLLLLLLVACGPPPPPPGPGVDVALAVRWTDGVIPRGTARFHLDADAPPGTTLWVDGAWWRVDLTLDGAPIGPVFPGYAPLDVPLPALAAGDHTLTVSVSLPTDETPVLTLPNKNTAPQAGRLELRLRGAARLGSLAVPLVDGALAPIVTATGAPDGASVELAVSRDGRVAAAWEPVAVGAALPPKRWTGGRWAIGEPQLYVATAVLRDAAGAVLDVRSERFGFRDAGLAAGRLVLDGAPSPLLALRAYPNEDPALVAASVAEAGANALELHGTIANGDWYARLDEWGLPVVQVPRCDGKLWAGGRDVQRTWQMLANELRAQDLRLLAASAARPALLAWVCEGTDHLRTLTCGDLHEDPLRRPILGLDLASAVIDGRHERRSTVPTWITEIGAPAQQHPAPPSLAAVSFVEAVGPGGPGGVFHPPPRTGDTAEWRTAWAEAASKLGATPWTLASRRASSVVTVRGLTPGTLVTLDAPWMATRGATADDTGVARIFTWYEGDATLRVGTREVPVTLRADVWEGTRRVDRSVGVDAAQ